MKRSPNLAKYISIVLCYFICTSHATSTLNFQKENYPTDTLLMTPFGPAFSSNIHFVDSKRHFIREMDANIQIAEKVSGDVSYEIKKCKPSEGTLNILEIMSNGTKSRTFNEGFPINGWITYALGFIHNGITNTIQYVSANWYVPSPPLKKGDQLLYLFLGLGGGTTISQIIQPVLQWGVSPAGGGDYWSICNWYVTGDLQFFHDSLIRIEPGTPLNGIIEVTSVSDTLFDYNASFIGYSTGLKIINSSRPEAIHFALEGYNIESCDEFPIDERVRFSGINVHADKEANPLISWAENNSIRDCNTYVEIVNGASINGQIDIVLNTPSKLKRVDDFYIYPNPANNYVHISPKEPLYNAKIEIYNQHGSLIYIQTCDYLDFEFDIGLQNFSEGVYIINLNYNKISNIRRKSSFFKLIKSPNIE